MSSVVKEPRTHSVRMENFTFQTRNKLSKIGRSYDSGMERRWAATLWDAHGGHRCDTDARLLFLTAWERDAFVSSVNTSIATEFVVEQRLCRWTGRWIMRFISETILSIYKNTKYEPTLEQNQSFFSDINTTHWCANWAAVTVLLPKSQME